MRADLEWKAGIVIATALTVVASNYLPTALWAPMIEHLIRSHVKRSGRRTQHHRDELLDIPYGMI